MTSKEQIVSLKKEATSDRIFSDVLHVFAMRQRARKDVTVGALKHNMDKAGFKYSPQELTPVLEKLSNLGFGKIERNTRGRIRALRDISVTLQSLGLVAAQKSSEDAIRMFRSRNRFGKLSAEHMESPPAPARVPTPAQAALTRPTKTQVVLTLMINEKPINVQVPQGLSPLEIAAIVSRLQGE